ncbi:MAG TPA: CHRD domain-containing protein [Brevundimonas sp.]|nr:CHRD domain-containing protein [Brevundimonas sp.]
MKTIATLVLAAAAAALGAANPSEAQGQSRSMTITLTGAAEGPGLGDPDGSGTAELRIDPEQGQFCYVLTVSGIAPARLAHIHKSPVGEAGGPIVVTLQPPTEGRSEGCAAITPALGRALLGAPADYYVNVHNPEHPGGAVRGQLG